jgi:hypothetical protein
VDAAEHITIDLAVRAVTDYELFLYDDCGVQRPVAWSNESGNGVDEHITYAASPGHYYIRVYLSTGSHSDSQPDELTVRH